MSLMNIISRDASGLLDNGIIQSMSVIDWGKAMARANEIIQKELLRYAGFDAHDPSQDDCPLIDVTNNSPGFDIIIKTDDGKLKRVQSKLRQVQGRTPFSRKVHFETTRRHSKKNSGEAAESGHVAYSVHEFDYVMISLVHIRNDIHTRNSVDNWSFTLIPIHELINHDKMCCITHIPPCLLQKYSFTISPQTAQTVPNLLT